MTYWVNTLDNPNTQTLTLGRLFEGATLEAAYSLNDFDVVEPNVFYASNPRNIISEHSFYPKVRRLNEILDDITKVARCAVEDNEPLTAYALTETLALLHSAVDCWVFVLKAERDFPFAHVFGSDGGGLRIEWRFGTCRSVRLVVPSDESGKLYMYVETPDEYDAISEVSAPTLARAILQIGTDV